MLGDLNDFVNTTLKDKEAVKKMRKPIAHSLNQMKLSIRKVCDKYRWKSMITKKIPINIKKISLPQKPLPRRKLVIAIVIPIVIVMMIAILIAVASQQW